MDNDLENKNLKNSQKEIINKVKKHVLKFKDTNLNLTYYLPHSPYHGYALLKYWISPFKNIFFIFKIIFKEIYLLSLENKFYLRANKITDNNKKIIITWGNKNDFDSEGNFYDKYFNKNTKKNKNTLWIVLKTDFSRLPKLKSNVIILYQKKDKKFSILKFITLLTKINYWKNLHFSHTENNAKEIWKKVENYFTKKIKYLYFPYEGQPFQNYVIKKSKEKNPSIKSFGYVHSFPLGLPLNFIQKKDSPQKLMVSGLYQKKYLCNNLNWRRHRVFVVKSLRFKKKRRMNSQIFLPYYIHDPIFIIKKLSELKNVKAYATIFDSLQVKNHPETNSSLVHKKLIFNIKKNIIKKNKILVNNSYSIFIGCSGAIIEAIVRNVRVIHISNEPILEIYSILWKFLNISKIIENVYIYNIKKNLNKENIIKIGNKKIIKKYLIN